MKNCYVPYVPSMDGIPGVMPGNRSLLPDPIEEEIEKFTSRSIGNPHACSGVEISVHKRRMMPCNKLEK